MNSIYNLYNYYAYPQIEQPQDNADVENFRKQFPMSTPIKIISKNTKLIKTIFIINKTQTVNFLKSQIKQKNKLQSGFSLEIDKKLLLGPKIIGDLDNEYSNGGFLTISIETTSWQK
jgi:hypothetical protein